MRRNIAERFRELRQSRGLPQAVLARMASTSPVTVNLIERWGIPPRNPSIRRRLAEALGLDPRELFDEQEVVSLP